MKYLLIISLLLTACVRQEPCTQIPPCLAKEEPKKVEKQKSDDDDDTLIMMMLLFSTMGDD